MTTAATYGFVQPTDDDWLKEGDDAISHNADVAASLFTYAEELAAAPGTRRENVVMDPLPVDPAATYLPGRCTLSTAPGYGRAICSAAGATYFIAEVNGDSDALAKTRHPVNVGDSVFASVEVRGRDLYSMGAQLMVTGYSLSGTTWATVGTVAATAVVELPPDNFAYPFEVSGTVPAGVTHVNIQVQFRRWGATYPEVGDWVYWRKMMLLTGAPDNVKPGYFDGNAYSARWAGTPNNSHSITALPIATQVGVTVDASPLRRDAVVDAGIKKRGGSIGTGGRAAVALRFDHHLDSFKAKVLPLLEKYRLPWGQMLNAGNIGTGDDNMTAAEIQAACYGTGGEVWNHSYSHSNIENVGDADREITQGLTAIRSMLPGLHIDGFAGAGQAVLFGMEGSDTPAKFYDSYPGRLVLAQHAFVRGYYPGLYQRMAQPNLVGAPHSTIDTLDYAYVNGLIRGAVSVKAGLTLMLHPNYLDTAGKMTTAILEQVLSYIAAERDSGALVVLSPTAILLADSTHGDRWNLVTTGAAGAVAGTWTETLSTRSTMGQYGVPHEAVAKVTATVAGSFALKVEIANAGATVTETHVLSMAAGQTSTLRVPVTPPLSTTSTVVTLTGTGTHTGINYWAT